MSFDDLLDANRNFSQIHDLAGFDGIAHAGVAMVTCMDSRIDPLAMIGLKAGDAKILRNPGGRVNDPTLVALVLSVAALRVNRILVVEHTRCAMASSSEEDLIEKISDYSNTDAHWMHLGVIEDQRKMLAADVHRVRSHPLIPTNVEVGGFLYDVDTGLMEHVAR